MMMTILYQCSNGRQVKATVQTAQTLPQASNICVCGGGVEDGAGARTPSKTADVLP